MRILALDTSTEFGSLALEDNGALVEEVPLYSPDGFAHTLFPQLERVLARHGWSFESVHGYAAAAGPGSFTGVRVGLTAVKGLAEAAGRKAAAISTLEAVAWFGASTLRAALMDARRGEIYGGLFDGALRAQGPEVVAKLADWLASLPDSAELEFVTPQPERFAEALAGRRVVAAPRSLARAVARLAANRLRDPAALDASYVRRADAEMKWLDRTE
jgi:tRNA threonylcarbamoyladenosine biosynthesis protein TsaB